MYIGTKIIAQIDGIVKNIVDGSNMKVPKRSIVFFKQMLLGIIGSKNILLSEIGHVLKERGKLIQTEKRLSYQLNNKRWNSENMSQGYLRWSRQWIKPSSVIAFDMGDITKEYSRKGPNLGWVWDGSHKTVARGWNMIKVVCSNRHQQILPLVNHVFHSMSHRYRSHNVQVKKVIETIVASIGTTGTWVFDRGFDDEKLFMFLSSLSLRYIVRIRGVRRLIPVDKPHRKALAISRILRLDIPKGDDIAFVPVSLPSKSIQGTLVISFQGKTPCYLFTNIPISSLQEAAAVVKKYYRRWSVEDTDRVLKTVFHLEKVRPRTFVALKRLVLLATWALAVLFMLSRLPEKLLRSLLTALKYFSNSYTIAYYRLAHGAAAIIKDNEALVFR